MEIHIAFCQEKAGMTHLSMVNCVRIISTFPFADYPQYTVLATPKSGFL